MYQQFSPATTLPRSSRQLKYAQEGGIRVGSRVLRVAYIQNVRLRVKENERFGE